MDGVGSRQSAATTALVIGAAAAVGAVAGGWVVAAALSDKRCRHDATTSERDGDGVAWISNYVSALRSRATTATTAAASMSSKLILLLFSSSSSSSSSLFSRPSVRPTNGHHVPPPLMPDVLSSIGNTPMMRVASLSNATGCDVLIKCEFANPGGSVKDRVALRIIQEALQSGELAPGGVITEGTAGSTGVSLAMVAGALGCKAHLALPDDAALEAGG